MEMRERREKGFESYIFLIFRCQNTKQDPFLQENCMQMNTVPLWAGGTYVLHSTEANQRVTHHQLHHSALLCATTDSLSRTHLSLTKSRTTSSFLPITMPSTRLPMPTIFPLLLLEYVSLISSLNLYLLCFVSSCFQISRNDTRFILLQARKSLLPLI